MAQYLGGIESREFINEKLPDLLKEVSMWIFMNEWDGSRGREPKPGNISVENVITYIGEEFGAWHMVVYYREYTH